MLMSINGNAESIWNAITSTNKPQGAYKLRQWEEPSNTYYDNLRLLKVYRLMIMVIYQIASDLDLEDDCSGSVSVVTANVDKTFILNFFDREVAREDENEGKKWGVIGDGCVEL